MNDDRTFAHRAGKHPQPIGDGDRELPRRSARSPMGQAGCSGSACSSCWRRRSLPGRGAHYAQHREVDGDRRAAP